MFIYRKYQHLVFYIRRHLLLSIFFSTTIILLLLFVKEIIYFVYIQILDIKPYKNAITFWSTDFHIRYINYKKGPSMKDAQANGDKRLRKRRGQLKRDKYRQGKSQKRQIYLKILYE